MANLSIETLKQMTSFTELLKAFKVDEALWKSILTQMDDPEFDDLDLAATVPG